jgi:hypothetical protein
MELLIGLLIGAGAGLIVGGWNRLAAERDRGVPVMEMTTERGGIVRVRLIRIPKREAACLN